MVLCFIIRFSGAKRQLLRVLAQYYTICNCIVVVNQSNTAKKVAPNRIILKKSKPSAEGSKIFATFVGTLFWCNRSEYED